MEGVRDGADPGHRCPGADEALNSLFIPAEAADAGVDAGFALLRPAVALAVFVSYVLLTASAARTLLRRGDV